MRLNDRGFIVSLSLSLSLVRCLDAPAAALVDVLQYCRMERAARRK